MIGMASYRMYINYWQRRTLKYLKYKVGMDHMIQCDVIITDLLRKPVDRLQSYSLVLNVSTVNCQNTFSYKVVWSEIYNSLDTVLIIISFDISLGSMCGKILRGNFFVE